MSEAKGVSSGAGGWAGWLRRAADLAPLVLPAALAAFGSVAVLFLQFGQFRDVYIWPLGLLAALLISVPIVKAKKAGAKGSEQERYICNVIAIAGVSVWVVFNVFFTAQHFLTNRDPGVYTTAGTWLVKHDNLEPKASDAFGDTAGVVAYSGGFSPDAQDSSKLNAQGQHLLPALLGLSGRIVGAKDMVRINVLIGGIALLAIYGFARQMVKPRWALVAASAVALSLPMMYFSRDTYTEPLAATFTFGALALLWLAQKNKSLSLWLVAGLVAGAGALTRIDAYLALAAILASLVIMLALSRGADRKRNIANVSAWLLGAAAPALVGFLDIFRLSTSYYLSERHNIRPELMLLALIFVAGAVFIAASWRTSALTWLDSNTRPWRARAAWAAVIAVALLLASRPLWYAGHGNPLFMNGTMIDASSRSFSAQTVNWLIWYLGPVLTALGALGAAYAASQAARRRDLLLVAPLFVIGGTALFYLIKPSIYPDQVWASRRFLPVIMPGLAVFGAMALEWLYGQRSFLRRKIPGKTLATILATLAVTGPLFISLPFLFTREDTWYAPVRAICEKAPDNAAILWVGAARARLVEPAQALCGLPSEGYGIQIFGGVKKVDRGTLAAAAKAARAQGFTPVIGVYESDKGVLDPAAGLTDATTFSYKQIEQTFSKPPRFVQTQTDTILLGTIDNGGGISPLSRR